MSAAGVVIEEMLYEGALTVAYRARALDGRRVILRALRKRAAPSGEARMLGQEREIRRLLGRKEELGSGAVAGLAARDFVISDDPGGVSLHTLVGTLDLLDALWIAVALVDLLGALHAQRIVHKDVNARNVLVDLGTRTVDCISFDLASRVPRETRSAVSPEVLEGVLDYMSPEQTGRMNRTLDYRTDFYSLGVVLYELFTGRLPFRKGDPLETIHAHLAVVPTPPHEVSTRVPRALSAIVLKLMAKEAEERYRGGRALRADLERCRSELSETGRVEDFPIGEHDVAEIFQVPQRLYGRDREVATMMAAFERAQRGARELVLVSGYSGIGKSALVGAIHKSVLHSGGLFLAGKYEQYQRDAPYLALARAFREAVRQILSGSAETIARFRDKLLGVFGVNGQLIVDVIPEVGLIVGEQPHVTELGASESQRRFRSLFQDFIEAFADGGAPLTLFLDDLQWADAASLQLIARLMTARGRVRLLLVGAYRENEVGATHPLALMLEELRKSGAAGSAISLGPLQLADTRRLVADTLRCPPEAAEPLAQILLAKTDGNPFFLIQFLHTLHERGLLTLDAGSGAWRWDEAGIRRMAGTENVVSLMAEKLRHLPEPTQVALQLAACIGNRFDLRTLSMVCERTVAATAADLWPAVREGQVIPSLADADAAMRLLVEGGGLEGAVTAMSPDDVAVSYDFLHDRVQQAAYSLVAEERRKAVHLRVGRLLVEDASAAEIEERVFDIVSHLDRCLDLVTDPAERRRIAELNLLAARKAKAATAHDLAQNHAAAGIEALPEDAWTAAYDLAYALHLLAAECRLLVGDSAEAERALDALLAHARTPLDKAKVHAERSIVMRHLARYGEAVDAAIAGLGLLGVEVPARDDLAGLGALVGVELGGLQERLRGRDIGQLIALPELDGLERLEVMALLEDLSILAMFFTPLLVQVATLKMVTLSLNHGNSRASPAGYATYGMILGSGLGDFRSGLGLGRLAIELSTKYGDPSARCKSSLWLGAFTSHWGEPMRVGLQTLKDACEQGERAGEPTWVAYAAFFVTIHTIFAGEPVDEALAVLERYYALVDPQSRFATRAYRQLLLCLQGETRGPAAFDDDRGYVEAAHVEEMQGATMGLARQHYFLTKLIALFLFDRVDEARRLIAAAAADGDIQVVLFGQLVTAEFVFFHALVAAAAHASVPEEERGALVEVLHKNKEKLRVWAESAPENFAHKHLLVSAEAARVGDREIEAMDLYERAVEAARAHGFIQDQAVATELHARFHAGKGRKGLAGACLHAARDLYARWGATAKVRQLERLHPELGGAAAPADGVRSAALDLATVTKAAQTMSGEIMLEALLQRMMAIMIENAGAERGYFVVERDGELFIEAGGSAGGERTALGSQRVEACPDIALAVIHYVGRTGEQVVLDDAAGEGRFASDPYVARAHARSILCAPIGPQKKRVGILYLENNLVAGAFTPGRLEVLEVLSAQAAISLENARLYDTLEQKVEHRTVELQEKNHELQATLGRLQQTREQLVVQAKLASLGALTSGIAHELKNPLNFVINFADISRGLAGELREEVQARLGDATLATSGIGELLTELEGSVGKIRQHGARADGVVRSMLEHARPGTGTRELTDLNALVGEFAGVASLGVRSADPGFEFELETRLDPALLPMMLVRQDVSRVLVNLMNNAWYATHARRKVEGGGFAARLTVETRSLGASVELRVRDNGTGIPAQHRDRIFTPFFTTKPTGDGTGLGLSISHDIVVAGNGGTLRFESTEGQGTEFVVTLPARS